MEWFEKYKGASQAEIITQALAACSRKDCAHCLYQGKGIACKERLAQDAAALPRELAPQKEGQNCEE